MTKSDKATLDQLLAGVDPSNPQSMFTDAGQRSETYLLSSLQRRRIHFSIF